MELSKGKPEELVGVPRDILEIVLYYLYSQSLPSDLTTEVANRCIESAPKFLSSEFREMCQEFIHRASLKQRNYQQKISLSQNFGLCQGKFCYFRDHITSE